MKNPQKRDEKPSIQRHQRIDELLKLFKIQHIEPQIKGVIIKLYLNIANQHLLLNIRKFSDLKKTHYLAKT